MFQNYIPRPIDSYRLRIAPLLIYFSSGARLDERYHIGDCLDCHGWGTNFFATDELNNLSPVTVSTIDCFADTQSAAEFFSRGVGKAPPSHPNLAQIYDQHLELGSDSAYQILEPLQSMSLESIVHDPTMAALDRKAAIGQIKQLCKGLEWGHKHAILHKNLTPFDVWKGKDGKVKILNMGLAMNLTSELGVIVPAYASMEQFDGRDIDESHDVYALGCIAYLLLTGRHPYNGMSAPKALSHSLRPPKLRGLTALQNETLQRSVAPARESRISDVSEFVSGFFDRKKHLWKGWGRFRS